MYYTSYSLDDTSNDDDVDDIHIYIIILYVNYAQDDEDNVSSGAPPTRTPGAGAPPKSGLGDRSKSGSVAHSQSPSGGNGHHNSRSGGDSRSRSDPPVPARNKAASKSGSSDAHRSSRSRDADVREDSDQVIFIIYIYSALMY